MSDQTSTDDSRIIPGYILVTNQSKDGTACTYNLPMTESDASLNSNADLSVIVVGREPLCMYFEVHMPISTSPSALPISYLCQLACDSSELGAPCLVTPVPGAPFVITQYNYAYMHDLITKKMQELWNARGGASSPSSSPPHCCDVVFKFKIMSADSTGPAEWDHIKIMRFSCCTPSPDYYRSLTLTLSPPMSPFISPLLTPSRSPTHIVPHSASSPLPAAAVRQQHVSTGTGWYADGSEWEIQVTAKRLPGLVTRSFDQDLFAFDNSRVRLTMEDAAIHADALHKLVRAAIFPEDI